MHAIFKSYGLKQNEQRLYIVFAKLKLNFEPILSQV